MPEEIDPQETTEPTEERFVKMKREDIKKLEEAAKGGTEAAQLKRELLFMKAGIDTDTPLGKMFLKSYDGELALDDLKKSASEIGLLEPEVAKVELTAEETKATKERQQAASGASGDTGTPDVHPTDAAKKKMDEIIKQGGTYEQAGAGFLSTKMQAWANGDKRAVKDPRNP